MSFGAGQPFASGPADGFPCADLSKVLSSFRNTVPDSLSAAFRSPIGFRTDAVRPAAPAQIPKHENILPAGYKDCSNQNSDDLLAILRKNGVPTLDLRNEMIRDGIDPSGAFFVTDHHWKTETGFWAYTKIVDYFEKNGIIEKIDSKYTDLNEYHIDIQKNSLLLWMYDVI